MAFNKIEKYLKAWRQVNKNERLQYPGRRVISKRLKTVNRNVSISYHKND